MFSSTLCIDLHKLPIIGMHYRLIESVSFKRTSVTIQNYLLENEEQNKKKSILRLIFWKQVSKSFNRISQNVSHFSISAITKKSLFCESFREMWHNMIPIKKHYIIIKFSKELGSSNILLSSLNSELYSVMWVIANLLSMIGLDDWIPGTKNFSVYFYIGKPVVLRIFVFCTVRYLRI